MTQSQWIALAMGALGVFWIIGAHNRLVTLRNGIGQAWAKVDEALRQRAQTAAPLMAALREPLSAEHGALDAVQAALIESVRSSASMQARTVDEAHAGAFVAAETALGAASSRLRGRRSPRSCSGWSTVPRSTSAANGRSVTCASSTPGTRNGCRRRRRSSTSSSEAPISVARGS